MIYSEDINKICGLCVNAKRLRKAAKRICSAVFITANMLRSAARRAKKFEYDILSVPYADEKKSAGHFKPEDFML